jgi:Spy/CpxP family protein refolding chaperone
MRAKRWASVWVLRAVWALQAAAGVTLAQSPVPPAPKPQPHAIPAIARGNRLVGPMDDFAGLKLTDAQQAKVREILEQTKSRIDAVTKSKLGPEQKGAMIQGYEHMERNQVYRVLDPEQQAVVRKRVLERREAARLDQEKTKQSAPQ